MDKIRKTLDLPEDLVSGFTEIAKSNYRSFTSELIEVLKLEVKKHERKQKRK